MRIDNFSQIQQLYGVGTVQMKQVASPSGSNFRDKLQISDAGKDLQIAKQAVQNAPDVREDKIAAIKSALANGTYNVSSDDFADRMMEKLGQTL
ncbi:MAG: flagellar biosynthesis anti-sigma factor FlgM [Lachnospiraceae bacterium]